MTTATENQADEARSALITDIRELKDAGHAAVERVNSSLPWIAGGAVSVVAIGVAIAAASRPRPSLLAARPRPTLVGKLVRAAVLAAIGYGTRHYFVKALDKVLPEREPSAAR